MGTQATAPGARFLVALEIERNEQIWVPHSTAPAPTIDFMSSKTIDLASIEARIQTLRSQQELLDSDMAALYRVSVKVLLQAVRRNRSRFPGFHVSAYDSRS